MGFCRKHVSHNQAIAWLLVIALTMQLLFQLQFHLHQTDISDSFVHDHRVDFHEVTDKHKTDHLTDGNTLELKSTPDSIVKTSLDSSLNFIIFVFLLLILPVSLTVINRQWSFTRSTIIHNLYYGLAPPLRAPPSP